MTYNMPRTIKTGLLVLVVSTSGIRAFWQLLNPHLNPCLAITVEQRVYKSGTHDSL